MYNQRSWEVIARAVLVSSFLVIVTACGTKGDAGVLTCATPFPNEGFSVDRSCATEILGNCPLHIAVPSGYLDPIFDTENSDGDLVVNGFLRPVDTDRGLPGIYLYLIRTPDFVPTVYPRPSFENQESQVIDGTAVAFYGNAQSRGASWSDSCLTYSVTAIPATNATEDPRVALLGFVRETLRSDANSQRE